MNNKNLPEVCPKCNQKTKWLWRRFKNAGGHLTFPYVCSECGHKTNILEKKKTVMEFIFKNGYKIENIPLLPVDEDTPHCEICGQQGAELHHYAPQHLFDNADDWPKGYLCVKHHREWHDKIKGHR